MISFVLLLVACGVLFAGACNVRIGTSNVLALGMAIWALSRVVAFFGG